MIVIVIIRLLFVVINAGNSGRLMEMLHGSDGWGKLVSELQQKEEDDAQQAAVQAEEPPPAIRCKRGRPPKDSSDPLAKGTRFARLLLFCNVVVPYAELWQLASLELATTCFVKLQVQIHLLIIRQALVTLQMIQHSYSKAACDVT